MNIISISQTDVEMWCQCPNCSKIIEEEGSVSGVWLRFVNKIAEELEDEYPEELSTEVLLDANTCVFKKMISI